MPVCVPDIKHDDGTVSFLLRRATSWRNTGYYVPVDNTPPPPTFVLDVERNVWDPADGRGGQLYASDSAETAGHPPSPDDLTNDPLWGYDPIVGEHDEESLRPPPAPVLVEMIPNVFLSHEWDGNVQQWVDKEILMGHSYIYRFEEQTDFYLTYRRSLKPSVGAAVIPILTAAVGILGITSIFNSAGGKYE